MGSKYRPNIKQIMMEIMTDDEERNEFDVKNERLNEREYFLLRQLISEMAIEPLWEFSKNLGKKTYIPDWITSDKTKEEYIITDKKLKEILRDEIIENSIFIDIIMEDKEFIDRLKRIIIFQIEAYARKHLIRLETDLNEALEKGEQ